jgi:integrase
VANLFKLTKDSRGRWRRQNLGRKNGADGQLVPATFFLSTDYREACKRVVLLEQMWEAVSNSLQEANPPAWRPGAYDIALAVARGEKDIIISPPAWADAGSLLAGYLADLRALFPFLNLCYEDALAQQKAQRFADNMEQDAHALLERARSINQTAAGTLHEALDAYLAYVTEKYTGKSNQRPQQRLVALLKKHCVNVALDRLDADAIDQWLAAWCKRPAGESKPLALTTCRNTLIALRQFVRWLSRSAAFRWEMPRGFTFPRCRIDKLPADRVKRRQHFQRTELALLWEYAHPWDRATILLALNCGFSKREIATLQKGEIVQKKDRTFIQRHRTKSDVYAEWELWPETCAALDYLGRRANDTPYAIVNERGNPLVRGTPKGNENQTIKNHWDRLLERVISDHPDFHRLPFKCLRKTGATYVRNLASAEVASMYLAHGERADDKDQLLSVYTSRPWRKVHQVLGKLRARLLSILTGVADPWKETNYRMSPRLRKEVLALRHEGKNYKEIAEMVNLHPVTVGKVCREEKDGGDS